MAQDVGIKISKPLYDVTTAGDADMLFSSSWPSLAVAYETTETNKTGTFSVTHSLGFVPFFQIWRIKSGASRRYGIGAGDNITNVIVSSSTVTITEDSFDPGAADYHIKLYNIDLTVEREYEFTRPPTSSTTSYDPNYGIKLVKEGEDIDSTDLRDFILHSRAQSPQVLSVITTVTTTSGGQKQVQYTDPQGYTAWVFAFAKDANGAYRVAPYHSQAQPEMDIDTSGTVNTYTGQFQSPDTSMTLVVLRDPMFAATAITAGY